MRFFFWFCRMNWIVVSFVLLSDDIGNLGLMKSLCLLSLIGFLILNCCVKFVFSFIFWCLLLLVRMCCLLVNLVLGSFILLRWLFIRWFCKVIRFSILRLMIFFIVMFWIFWCNVRFGCELLLIVIFLCWMICFLFVLFLMMSVFCCRFWFISVINCVVVLLLFLIVLCRIGEYIWGIILWVWWFLIVWCIIVICLSLMDEVIGLKRLLKFLFGK